MKAISYSALSASKDDNVTTILSLSVYIISIHGSDLLLHMLVILHQETGKNYVAPTRGYGGYTHHVTLSVVPIALVSLRSPVSGLDSCL